MENYLLEWASLLLRWLHVTTAIAWVGSSFYFVFLDSSLTPPVDEDLKRQGVGGELWAVHGGGFYHPVKFTGAPPQLPNKLHWFYWESYSTWLSGFALLTATYFWHAGAYLVDPARMPWSPAAAVGAAIGFLLGFWLLYDGICRWCSRHQQGEKMVGALVAVLVAAACWLACHWFAGRAAFLLLGAALATSMSANVLFWIIPGQRKMVAAVRAGLQPDPVHGRRGKQRSVHNTYFTLPVLFAMLSNHYSFTYNHPHNALVLALMVLAGAAIRQFFVLRHGFKLGRNRHPWRHAAGGVAAVVGVMVWLRPPAAGGEPTVPAATVSIAIEAAKLTASSHSDYELVRDIVARRCLACHGAQLQMKNIRLDSAQALQRHAPLIYQQVVVSRQMPMNNATGMTQEERTAIARWFEAGAAVPP